MAQSTVLKLRNAWLQVHKWIGLVLAIVIIPLSVSGALLVWDEALDHVLNPARYAVNGAPRLAPSAYAAAAQAALGPDERVVSLRYPDGAGGPVVASATKVGGGHKGGGDRAARPGPPERTNVWLDPADAHVLDKASSNSGPIRVIHRLHGSLLVPGWGRTIVGVVGVAMFLSCLTGLWLWWPVTGSLRRGFRWRRQNSLSANLHHLTGFWILLPLAMLSFTGAWISFPKVFSAFEATQPKGGGGEDRARAARAKPLAHTATSADAALAAARPLGGGGKLATIAWPTDQAPEWKIAFAAGGAPAEVTVDDATARAAPPKDKPETTARLMRRLHDGTRMGPVWQALIFLGGIIPALLAITGVIMWLRSRGWRATLREKRKAARLAAAAGTSV
jgi:uncharacterized iron-regulated membrane protein